MSVSVDSTQGTASNSNTASGVSAAGSTTLTSNDFLQLLVAQLTNQDPTSPMDTSQFVSQLAQLNTLEQTQNMSDAISQMASTESQNSLASEANLIGKTITWTPSGSDQASQSGVVKAVNSDNGTITYLTDSGASVEPSTVTQIEAN